MSTRSRAARTISEHALRHLSLEACLALLRVADDFRHRRVPEAAYDQGEFCGTAYCVAGHAADVLDPNRNMRVGPMRVLGAGMFVPGLTHGAYCLFGSGCGLATYERVPLAVEAFVYDGDPQPWLAAERLEEVEVES